MLAHNKLVKITLNYVEIVAKNKSLVLNMFRSIS
jgi:hypothetical protein